VESSGAKGIVFGNSGGKDSALVGILCKAACDNTVGVIMPCASKRNFGLDADDGRELAEQYGIETRLVDLTPVREQEIAALSTITELNDMAVTNIAPRLRMTTLYAIAAAEGLLVAGTGNRSEAYMGYFTKWGDGAYDLNPIYDLTVTEVYEFLRFLDAPAAIIEKAPSAALFDGQTDEAEMGITYAEIDEYLLRGTGTPENVARIESAMRANEHKIKPVNVYNPDGVR
jgi:NAD+ synthase